jgi:hypothetical protein
MNRKIGWANLNKHTLEEISTSVHRVFKPQASYQTHQLSNTGNRIICFNQANKTDFFFFNSKYEKKEEKFHLLRDVILRYYKRLLMLLIIPTSILIFCVYCNQR